MTLPLEITAASITLSFWPGAGDVNPAAFVVIFWAVIVLINLFGVKGYGEAEFVFSIISELPSFRSFGPRCFVSTEIQRNLPCLRTRIGRQPQPPSGCLCFPKHQR